MWQETSFRFCHVNYMVRRVTRQSRGALQLVFAFIFRMFDLPRATAEDRVEYRFREVSFDQYVWF